MDYRQSTLSSYERQIGPGIGPLTAKLFMGTNLADYWSIEGTDYDRQEFLAQFEFPLLPTVGNATSARGKSIIYNTQYMCAKQMLIKVLDYDEALIDQFKAWQYNRTELRVYSYMEWYADGYLISIPINRPRTTELVITFTPHTLYMFKESVVNVTPSVFVDATGGHHLYTNYASFASHLQVYGGT